MSPKRKVPPKCHCGSGFIAHLMHPSTGSWHCNACYPTCIRGTNPARRGVRHGEMRELELYIDNTEPLYRQSQAIQKNLLRKIAKGRYDHSKAPKLWLYLVNEGARRYVKEFGGDGRIMFPLAGKKNLAQRYANQFVRMLRSGEIKPNPWVRGAVATINSSTAPTPMWMR